MSETMQTRGILNPSGKASFAVRWFHPETSPTIRVTNVNLLSTDHL
jgi:hypothetical protein